MPEERANTDDDTPFPWLRIRGLTRYRLPDGFVVRGWKRDDDANRRWQVRDSATGEAIGVVVEKIQIDEEGEPYADGYTAEHDTLAGTRAALALKKNPSLELDGNTVWAVADKIWMLTHPVKRFVWRRLHLAVTVLDPVLAVFKIAVLVVAILLAGWSAVDVWNTRDLLAAYVQEWLDPKLQ